MMTPFPSESPITLSSPSRLVVADSPQRLDLSSRRRRQRPKRISPISETATDGVALGTLSVSLPSGRVLTVSDESPEEPLSELIGAGDNLLEKLDGKGAQILTLQAFCGTPRPRMFARLKSGERTQSVSFLCEFGADPSNPAARLATIDVTAVHFARGPQPEHNEFITRHNSGCGIIYFDAASVLYLGHFPSEKTGSSLFSIVHSDDALILHSVHRQLRSGVPLARSAALRIVAHDGRVWRVNSEWAAFTNPWSDVVEMVVAKHTVVDLCTDEKPSLLSDEQCREHDAIIRQILENPIKPTESPKADTPPQTPNALSYNQINCLENVHRLLKSQTDGSSPSPVTSTQSTPTVPTIPLTREHLQRHDKRWQAACKGDWNKRLQLKRAISANISPIAPKVPRTGMSSPIGGVIPTNNATLLNYLRIILEYQQQLQQQQQSPPSGLPDHLIRHSASWDSGASTPSNL